MNKFIIISLISTLLIAVVLSIKNPYYGSWAFYVLGIMLVIFVGANVSGKIYSETVKILQENNNQK